MQSIISLFKQQHLMKIDNLISDSFNKLLEGLKLMSIITSLLSDQLAKLTVSISIESSYYWSSGPQWVPFDQIDWLFCADLNSLLPLLVKAVNQFLVLRLTALSAWSCLAFQAACIADVLPSKLWSPWWNQQWITWVWFYHFCSSVLDENDQKGSILSYLARIKSLWDWC